MLPWAGVPVKLNGKAAKKPNPLKEFAVKHGILMTEQKDIAAEVIAARTKRNRYTTEYIKQNFDALFEEIEKEMYAAYLVHEERYAKRVIGAYIEQLVESEKVTVKNISKAVADLYFPFDRFFLSLSQSRKSRAGNTFEATHNSLFKTLEYPFDEQAEIDGIPDFVMPSKKHYDRNPLDCIIFTAKRTVRERWKQIVTEGSRGMGFYLATIDPDLTSMQLKEMLRNRIYLVVPKNIKDEYYRDEINVLSFTQFFQDRLDPAVQVWRRYKVI